MWRPPRRLTLAERSTEMAMRCALSGVPRRPLSSSMAIGRRWFSDGRVLSDEERAKENVYIQKMERERLEKLKRKAEREKAEAERLSGKRPAEEKTEVAHTA